MRRLPLFLGVLFALAGPAASADIAAPVSDAPLHFRLEVGVESVRVIAGFIDESKGTGKGYDSAFLDLDGDGTPEAKQDFPTKLDPRTKKETPDPKVRIEHEGAIWVLDLYSVGRRRPVARDGRVRASIRWSVTRGDFYAWFINGAATLWTSEGAAGEDLPISLGRYLAFEVTSSTRGPEAMLNVGLKDPNDCTLRLAQVGKEMRLPNVVLQQCCC